MDAYPQELECDLQRYYGIDLERRGHTPSHVALMAENLPKGALTVAAIDPDGAWTEEMCLLAEIRNLLCDLIWGMAEKRHRGARPQRIGPSWMSGRKKLDSAAVTVDELNRRLAAARHG